MTSKQFLYVLIITLITIVTWVTFNILQERSKNQVSPEILKLLEPISPNLDQEAIDEL